MNTLESLRKALTPLSEIGNVSDTFSVQHPDGHDIRITLRVLLPDEDIDVQRYSAETLLQEDDEEVEGEKVKKERTTADLTVFFDHFRASTLSYSLIAVNGESIPEGIETGEVFDRNGVEVRIKRPKHEVLREEILGWNRVFVTRIFERYGDITTRSEQQADQAIKFDDKDLDDQISFHEQRLTELQERKKRHNINEELHHKEVAQQLEAQNSGRETKARKAIEKAQRMQEQQQSRQKDVASSRRRTPVRPKVQADQIPERSVESPASDPKPAPEPVVASPDRTQVSESSMVDFSDKEAVDAAVAVEQQRALERTLEIERNQQEATARRKSIPPHAAARQAAKEMDTVNQQVSEMQVGDQKIPVFSMGSQVLSARNQAADQKQADQKVQVDGGSRQPVNPNFTGRSPKRG